MQQPAPLTAEWLGDSIPAMAFDESLNPAALFDLDGVIIDTEGQYTLFWDMIGRQYLRRVNFGAEVKGKTLKRIFADCFASTPADAKNEIAKAMEDFEAKMEMPYIAGFKEFFADLAQSGWKTAIVTSSNEKKMKSVYRKLPELLEMFDKIFTAEMFTESKPAPDPYLIAAAGFSLPASNCLVFEDSISGLISGKSAGMKTAGLATTNPAETVAKYADIVLPNFAGFTAEKALLLLKG